MIKKHKIQIFSIIFLFFISLSIHFFDGFKNGIKNQLGFNTNHILSSIIGFQVDENKKVDIFKIKKNEQLFLEIYEHKSHKLIQQIPFKESHDAYFNINNRSTNLFSANLGKSKQVNIYIPVYNKNLKASLYAFQYDKDLKQFVIIN